MPFLVPSNTVAALDNLCDANIRSDCGVLSSNMYLFHSTNNSVKHVYDWLAVHKWLGLTEAAGTAETAATTAATHHEKT